MRNEAIFYFLALHDAYNTTKSNMWWYCSIVVPNKFTVGDAKEVHETSVARKYYW